jgi:hypothetical protein
VEVAAMLDVLLAHLRTARRDLVIQMAESLSPERRLPDAGYRQAQGRPADQNRVSEPRVPASPIGAALDLVARREARITPEEFCG